MHFRELDFGLGELNAHDIAIMIKTGFHQDRKKVTLSMVKKIYDHLEKHPVKSKAVEKALAKIYKQEGQTLFVSRWVGFDGVDLTIQRYTKTDMQVMLALTYQYQIIPFVLDSFNQHFGSHGSRNHKTMTKSLDDLIQYCKDTRNASYTAIKDIKLSDPMSKPEFKRKVIDSIARRFVDYGTDKKKISATNATKLAKYIVRNAAKFDLEKFGIDDHELKIFNDSYDGKLLTQERMLAISEKYAVLLNNS